MNMEIKQIFKQYIYPVAVFSGTMIGVGFLALPYITLRAGAWVMLAYFIAITALVVFISLIFAEISLKTPDFKRFPGFVGHYLGKYAQTFAVLSAIFAIFGVLLVYLIVGGQFLDSALRPILQGNLLTYTLIYFLLATLIVYFDIKAVSRAEFWVLLFLLASLVFIFFQAFPMIRASRIYFDYFKSSRAISDYFLPYGALLFSLWGIGIIPETEEMLRGDKKRFKRIIAYSVIGVSIFYFLFTCLILSVSGSSTTQTALTGLEKFLGRQFLPVALLAGALATFTAFITQATILKKIFIYDLKIRPWQAFVMTCFTPLILLLSGLNSFIHLISFIGGVLVGVDGIFILMMYRKTGGKNIIIYPLAIIFLLGIIYEIFYFIK